MKDNVVRLLKTSKYAYSFPYKYLVILELHLSGSKKKAKYFLDDIQAMTNPQLGDLGWHIVQLKAYNRATNHGQVRLAMSISKHACVTCVTVTILLQKIKKNCLSMKEVHRGLMEHQNLQRSPSMH